jgi:hypothetical protein
VSYSITGSPKSTRKLPTTGIGHHINSLQNPNPSRQNQPIQQQQTGKMPQYGGGGEKCARCLKSVYLAERKVGAGRVCCSINNELTQHNHLFFSHFILVALIVIHVIEN